MGRNGIPSRLLRWDCILSRQVTNLSHEGGRFFGNRRCRALCRGCIAAAERQRALAAETGKSGRVENAGLGRRRAQDALAAQQAVQVADRHAASFGVKIDQNVPAKDHVKRQFAREKLRPGQVLASPLDPCAQLVAESEHRLLSLGAPCQAEAHGIANRLRAVLPARREGHLILPWRNFVFKRESNAAIGGVTPDGRVVFEAWTRYTVGV